MSDPNAIAKQFVDYYYSTFDSNRAGLAGLYRDASMLTFETSQNQGSKDIVEKLQNLPFQKVQHRISTLDAQPASQTEASILCVVTGQLMVDDTPDPLQYTQTFLLRPENGSYYVQNDVFRLVYG